MAPDALINFGYLTDIIQIKGSLALAKVSANGIYIDLKYLSMLKQRVLAQIDYAMIALQSMGEEDAVLLFICLFCEKKLTKEQGIFDTTAPEGSYRCHPPIKEDLLAKKLLRAASLIDFPSFLKISNQKLFLKKKASGSR